MHLRLSIAVLFAFTTFVNGLDQTTVDGIRTQIRQMINDDLRLLGGLVRLAFHDCVGDRCDGCINNNHPENAGLEVYINRVEQLYTTLEVNGARVEMSRADFWALAGIEAVFISNEKATCRGCPENRPNIIFHTGRMDCSTSPTTDEMHDFPSALRDTEHVLAFFESQFGFNEKEATAILGAHTLGLAHRNASGFVHPWVARKNRLDNEFYIDLQNASKGWFQRPIGPPENELWFWENDGDRKQLMLNTDMALIRNLSSMNDAGKVECNFNTCPVVDSETVDWVAAFADDNDLWIDEFSKAFQKMIESGWSGQLKDVGDEIVDDTSTIQPVPTVQPGTEPVTVPTPSILDQLTVDGIKTQIRQMITNDLRLLGGLVRLAFHDCVGDRCDGCINNNHPENAGLEVYINILEPLYTTLKVNGARVDISRADFWALAGIEAVHFANEKATCNRCPEHIPNIIFHTGRVDCPTSPTTDEMHGFPSALGDTKHVLEFFKNQFDFDEREATAILGAHTLGRAHSSASGFVHPWVAGKNRLDNEFYIDLQNASKGWFQRSIGPTEKELWFWENDGDRKQLMLNTDMALIRNLSSMNNAGKVECDFNTCPVVDSETVDWVAAFADDNDLWIDEFSKAFQKMIESGWSGQLQNVIDNTDDDSPGAVISAARGFQLLLIHVLKPLFHFFRFDFWCEKVNHINAFCEFFEF